MTDAERPPYFAVSAPKFVVMSLASFGIYGFYWLYENWVLERAHTGEELEPAAPKNDTYTGMNVLLIVVGLIFYGLVIIRLMAAVENETLTH